MNRKLIKFIFVILSFGYLSGCISPDSSSCLVEVAQSKKSNNQANIKTIPCTNNEIVAVTQPDGNIYIYDICQKKLSQLTSDGLPDSDSYYFFDNSATWSSDGSKLLLGKNSEAQIIDLQNDNQVSIGQKVPFATWSPDGREIAIVQFLGDEDKPWEREHDAISVINAQTFSTELSFEGTSPVWMSNSELIYFPIVEIKDSHVLNNIVSNIVKVNLSNESKTLCPKLRTNQAPPRYARLSENKRYGAVYSAMPPNLAIFDLGILDTFSVEWLVNSGDKAIRWSPTESLLAICTGGHGGMDGPLPETALGAILLVKPNESPQIFSDQRCLYQSQIEWHPSGNMIAFLNTDHELIFLDVVAGEYLKPTQSDKLKFDKGPWWSPSGHYIGVISDDEVYVAEFNEKELVFEYVTDGTDISWQPLK